MVNTFYFYHWNWFILIRGIDFFNGGIRQPGWPPWWKFLERKSAKNWMPFLGFCRNGNKNWKTLCSSLSLSLFLCLLLISGFWSERKFWFVFKLWKLRRTLIDQISLSKLNSSGRISFIHYFLGEDFVRLKRNFDPIIVFRLQIRGESDSFTRVNWWDLSDVWCWRLAGDF